VRLPVRSQRGLSSAARAEPSPARRCTCAEAGTWRAGCRPHRWRRTPRRRSSPRGRTGSCRAGAYTKGQTGKVGVGRRGAGSNREGRSGAPVRRPAEGAAHRYSLKRRFLRSRTSIMMYSRTSISRDLFVVRDHAAVAASSLPAAPLLSPADLVRARFTRGAGSLPSEGCCCRLRQRGFREAGG
jgi:hypothetical protein